MRLIYSRWAFLALLTACAPTTHGPTISKELAAGEAKIQREMAVKESMNDEERLARIARTILVNNAELCGSDIGLYTGAQFLSLSAVPNEYEETYTALYGINDQPTVALITAKSPASGKLQVGDVVKEVNGKKISKGNTGVMALTKILEDEKNETGLDFIVDRDGKDRQVSIQPVFACNYNVSVEDRDGVNAQTDGRNVKIWRGMMRFAESDNELALVLGHEVAHNSREHNKSRTGNAVIGALIGGVITVATGVDVTSLGSDIGGAAFSQGFESEADYVGLYHTARAGYPIAEAPKFWRRMAASNPGAIHIAGSTHPSTAVRFLALEESVKEIQRKKAAGIRLAPEEKPSQQNVAQKETGPNN